jgi:hypothetical protein
MRLLFIIATAVLLSIAAAASAAAETLDQQNDATGSGTSDTASPFGQEIAQTFTVGITGTLTRIETQINTIFGSGGTVILTVFNTSGGVPNASLGSASKAWDAIPSGGFAFQSFDVSSFAIPVHAGDVMAFGIKSSGETGFGLRSTFNMSTYAGGEAKFRAYGTPPGPWQSFSFSHDYGFKTYVLASPTGIPGDFNNDGSVTAADYVTWRKYLGAPTEAALNGHGDNQNGVDQGDYILWRAHFGAPIGSGSLAGASIPEPDTALLMIVALGAISTCGSRRSAARIRR